MQDLLPGTCELIREVLQRLRQGESFDNPKLGRLAERAFGGSRSQGRYTPRDAYDAFEAAVSQFVLEELAPNLLENDANALAQLRSLLQRLTTKKL